MRSNLDRLVSGLFISSSSSYHYYCVVNIVNVQPNHNKEKLNRYMSCKLASGVFSYYCYTCIITIISNTEHHQSN